MHNTIKETGITIAIISTLLKKLGAVLLFGRIDGENVGLAINIRPEVSEPVKTSSILEFNDDDTEENVFEKDPSVTEELNIADRELYIFVAVVEVDDGGNMSVILLFSPQVIARR